MNMRLGDKIKKIRDLKGLKQEEMATKLNITPQAYSKIERNETRIDAERLEQIAQIFGITVESIQQFDDRNLFFNHMQECQDSITINNYYNSDQTFLEKIIEQQKEEITFLRAQLEKFLNSKLE